MIDYNAKDAANTMASEEETLWIDIHKAVAARDERFGQALFNALPFWVKAQIRGTVFDPFYTLRMDWEVKEWIDNHLIFDTDRTILAVFNRNSILAERPQ